jgi:ferrochelatase
LLQLGTPDAPTSRALRRYLREFLLDPRVIDLPRALWLPVLYGAVLTRRPKQSAALYRKVWTAAGSPLAVITAEQASALEARYAAAGTPIPVVVGMRYGNPSIAAALDELERRSVDRILAFPMYPQYAGATTGSSLEKLFDEAGKRRVVPAIRVVPPYYDDPAYISALVETVRDSLPAAAGASSFDRLLLSFHGLPKRYATEGDPYPDHCRVTTELVAQALPAGGPRVELIFQSRFGREEWLQPYLDKTLEALGRERLNVAVMSPGFTADCLETIEEVGLRGAEQFHATGGGAFQRVTCLNTHPAWMAAMETISRRELAGWIETPPSSSADAQPAALAAR